MKRVTRIVVGILLAVAALAIVVVRSAAEAKFIKLDGFWLFWTAVIAAGVVFIDQLAATIAAFRQPGIERIRSNTEGVSRGLIRTIHDLTGVEPWAIGVSVFLAERQFSVGPSRLKRLVRMRLSDSPQPSGVSWTPGKGAIGQAWKQTLIVHRECAHVADLWRVDGGDRAAFDRLSVEQRDNFSYREFRVIADKYAEILAVPIWSENGEKVLGVVAVDLPRTVPGAGALLSTQAIEETVVQTSALLASIVPSK